MHCQIGVHPAFRKTHAGVCYCTNRFNVPVTSSQAPARPRCACSHAAAHNPDVIACGCHTGAKIYIQPCSSSQARPACLHACQSLVRPSTSGSAQRRPALPRRCSTSKHKSCVTVWDSVNPKARLPGPRAPVRQRQHAAQVCAAQAGLAPRSRPRAPRIRQPCRQPPAAQRACLPVGGQVCQRRLRTWRNKSARTRERTESTSSGTRSTSAQKVAGTLACVSYAFTHCVTG